MVPIDPKCLEGRHDLPTASCPEKRNAWIQAGNGFFLPLFKRYGVLLALVANLVVYTAAADGTSREHIMRNLVEIITRDMGQYERAYRDIEQMAASIGTAGGLKNADEGFLLAFLITKWSREFGFDPLEVAAVAFTESRFDRRAVSPKDARGLMQIHAPTWSMDDYFNAEKNIRQAVQILFMYRNSQPDSYLKLYFGNTGEKGVEYVNKIKENYGRLKELGAGPQTP